jgi:hypothetical protein
LILCDKKADLRRFFRLLSHFHEAGNQFQKCVVSIVGYAQQTIVMSPTYNDDLTPLIERCRRYERTAQNQLHKILYRYVFAICYRYVGEIDETKEVVQDVFFKAFTKLKHYEGHLLFRIPSTQLFWRKLIPFLNGRLSINTIRFIGK